MISRLVLVGMVAALGVTLPSWAECANWFNSAREWTSGRLADWDTWRPREAEFARVADAFVPARREYGLRGGLSATALPPPLGAPRGREASGETAAGSGLAPRRQPIAFDPIAADADPLPDIAGELNRWAEGLDIQASTVVSRGLQTVPSPMPARDVAAWEVVIESCRVAEVSGLPATVAVAAEARASRSGPPEPIADFFEENPDGYEPSGEGLAPSVVGEPPSGAVRPRFDPIELPADLAGGIAEELNRFAEGMGIRVEDASNPIARSRRFEPIEPVADAHSGIAEELNRRSEGLELLIPRPGEPVPSAHPLLTDRESPAPRAGSPSQPGLQARQSQPPPRGDRLAAGGDLRAQPATAASGLDQAIQLTRAAAYAWMDVLAGPAQVTMTLR